MSTRTPKTNAIRPNKRVMKNRAMKDGEPNKRELIEAAIKEKAKLLNESVSFWEKRMEQAFCKLEKFDYLEDDPFSEKALEISEEDSSELESIYQEIEFVNKRCSMEIENMNKLEEEIEDFINEDFD